MLLIARHCIFRSHIPWRWFSIWTFLMNLSFWLLYDHMFIRWLKTSFLKVAWINVLLLILSNWLSCWMKLLMSVSWMMMNNLELILNLRYSLTVEWHVILFDKNRLHSLQMNRKSVFFLFPFFFSFRLNTSAVFHCCIVVLNLIEIYSTACCVFCCLTSWLCYGCLRQLNVLLIRLTIILEVLKEL